MRNMDTKNRINVLIRKTVYFVSSIETSELVEGTVVVHKFCRQTLLYYVYNEIAM